MSARWRVPSYGAAVLLAWVLAWPGRAADTLCLSDSLVTVVLSASDGSVRGLSARYVRGGRPWARADYAVPGDPGPVLQLLLGDSVALPLAPARITRSSGDGDVTVELTHDSVAPGVALTTVYRLDKGTYMLELRILLRGDSAQAFARRRPLGLRVACGPGFTSAHGEGFAAGSRVPDWVLVRQGPARAVASHGATDTVAPGTWAGPRNRFFALLARPLASGVALGPADSTGSRDVVTLVPDGASLALRVYAGPIDRFGPGPDVVRRLQFSTLWFWMRWLSQGMLYLLHWLIALTGVPGLAVMLLSVCVKVLMYPLTHVAERWQRQVNETKSRLAPLLANVARQYKGEERHRRTLDVYRQQGVSPVYTFKSLASAAIQIPIFFAAYHMLHENVELAGVGFLWVNDLAFPDHALLLPLAIPFFGRYLNLLPLAMTALTLLTSWVHHDRSLSPELHRRQQVNLYLMAIAFLALFYTFPAGMVLYWTTNNLLALLVAVWRRTRGHAHA